MTKLLKWLSAVTYGLHKGKRNYKFNLIGYVILLITVPLIWKVSNIDDITMIKIWIMTVLGGWSPAMIVEFLRDITPSPQAKLWAEHDIKVREQKLLQELKDKEPVNANADLPPKQVSEPLEDNTANTSTSETKNLISFRDEERLYAFNELMGRGYFKMNEWPTYDNIESFYGVRGENQVMLKFPYPMQLTFGDRSFVNRTSCHKLVRLSLERVLNAVLEIYRIEEIKRLRLDQFAGCLNVRRMKGDSDKWSTHSWGVALDFDNERNAFRMGPDEAAFAGPEYDVWWKIWEAEGWVSLGREIGIDYMHVQAVKR